MKKMILLAMTILMLFLLGILDGYQQKKMEWEQENVKQEPIPVKESKKMEDREEMIRVLIKSDNFASEYHENIRFCAENGFYQKDRLGIKRYDKTEGCTISPSDFKEKEDVIYLTSEDGYFCLPDLKRGWEAPVYYGTMEVRKTEEGLLLINELPMETYLCGVLPSEMPSAYPMEALKAQAVCARTYAGVQKLEKREKAFFADVDDSVSFQVYNNQMPSKETTQAVRETAHQVLMEEGKLADTWYYSTSCGINVGMDFSKDAVFAAFLMQGGTKAYESGEPWFRWSTTVGLGDTIRSLEVTKRAPDGRAEELLIRMEGGVEETVCGEYGIREYLGALCGDVTLQDGSCVADMALLPSAYFILQPEYKKETLTGYQMLGGGYGHGNGMSQNGAKCMAEEGIGYEEILENYYGKEAYLAKEGET